MRERRETERVDSRRGKSNDKETGEKEGKNEKEKG